MMRDVYQKHEWTQPSTHWVEEHWTEMTPEAPCPVCGATQGCSTLRNEPFVHCARQPSEWPMTVGGWLHHVATPPVSESPVLDRGAELGSDAA